MPGSPQRLVDGHPVEAYIAAMSLATGVTVPALLARQANQRTADVRALIVGTLLENGCTARDLASAFGRDMSWVRRYRKRLAGALTAALTPSRADGRRPKLFTAPRTEAK
jgi:hypothetical protein